MIFSNGKAEYEGEWKNGKPNGNGVYKENGRVKYEGKFENGVPKKK